MASRFPLRKVSTSHLQELSQVLWSWKICENCLVDKQCKGEECPWQRSKILGRFFQFYKDRTGSFQSDQTHGQPPPLRTHKDLFAIIRELRSNPDLTKTELMEIMFIDRPVRNDQERAVNLAAQILTMIDCSSSCQSPALLEHGTQQFPWLGDVSFSQHMADSLPISDHPGLPDLKEKIQATKLKKRARLLLQPTDDLRNHLKLNKRTAVIEIFHHAAFLKESLRLTRDQPQNLSSGNSFKLYGSVSHSLLPSQRGHHLNFRSGAIPRSIALETLSTLQDILFPPNDPKSKALLLSLTSTSGANFDPDILRYELTSICTELEASQTIQHHHFGARMVDLYEELNNPTPHGLEKWFERKSGGRYVMMVTIAAVILAFASLGLGAIQVWVGYQAWQHPT